MPVASELLEMYKEWTTGRVKRRHRPQNEEAHVPIARYLLESSARYNRMEEGALAHLHPRNVTAQGREKTRRDNEAEQWHRARKILKGWGPDTKQDKEDRRQEQSFNDKPEDQGAMKLTSSPKVTNPERVKSPLMRAVKSAINNSSYEKDLKSFVMAAHKRYGSDPGYTTQKVTGVYKQQDKPKIHTEKSRVTSFSGWPKKDVERLGSYLGRKHQQDGVLVNRDGKKTHWVDTSEEVFVPLAEKLLSMFHGMYETSHMQLDDVYHATHNADGSLNDKGKAYNGRCRKSNLLSHAKKAKDALADAYNRDLDTDGSEEAILSKTSYTGHYGDKERERGGDPDPRIPTKIRRDSREKAGKEHREYNELPKIEKDRLWKQKGKTFRKEHPELADKISARAGLSQKVCKRSSRC